MDEHSEQPSDYVLAFLLVSRSSKDHMQPFSKTFSLLSIGQRGVGKTVFLTGSYAQLQHNPSNLTLSTSKLDKSDCLFDRPPPFEFECQDEEMQTNLEKILHHVQQTGLYPPATVKITNFNFRLNQHTATGKGTICTFRWWDIPGEACDLRNPEFQEIRPPMKIPTTP